MDPLDILQVSSGVHINMSTPTPLRLGLHRGPNPTREEMMPRRSYTTSVVHPSAM